MEKEFNYKTIYTSLIKGLSSRAVDIIDRRFGLKGKEKETLESIGKSYDITRERVRQIEEEAFSKARPRIKDHKEVFDHFNNILTSFGGLKREDALLSYLAKKQENYVFFLLSLAEGIERVQEDEDFHSYWSCSKSSIDDAEKVINSSIDRLNEEKKPFFINEFYNLEKPADLNEEVFTSYIEISKNIQKNPEGKIGLRSWIEINPRGIKDRAYLVVKNAGKPLHFKDVAESIRKSPFFARKEVHTATVHNELIKDTRFVLVGRGLYGLKEWGYEPGVVKDVIVKVLREANEPLTKEDIIEKVLKQRVVKANTVFLNLQDKKYFIKDSQGRYGIIRKEA